MDYDRNIMEKESKRRIVTLWDGSSWACLGDMVVYEVSEAQYAKLLDGFSHKQLRLKRVGVPFDIVCQEDFERVHK